MNKARFARSVDTIDIDRSIDPFIYLLINQAQEQTKSMSAKPPSKESQIYTVGATVFAKASASTNNKELHRRFGSKIDEVWVPGIVKECTVKKSASGKNMKYCIVSFYLGFECVKTLPAPLSSLHISYPKDCRLPEHLERFRADGGVFIPTIDAEAASQASSITEDPTLQSPPVAADSTAKAEDDTTTRRNNTRTPRAATTRPTVTPNLPPPV